MDIAKPICVKCESPLTRWFGMSSRSGGAKYQCLSCGEVFTLNGLRIGGNHSTPDQQEMVIRLLVEGNSLRGTVRLTGASINTVKKLLLDAGEAASRYEDSVLRGITTRQIQCDEIWSFIKVKRRNLPLDEQHVFGIGDVWTWTAVDADSRLVLTWRLGPRDSATAEGFMRDVADRLANRVSLTTDGFRVYMRAVGKGFKGDTVDHLMLVGAYDRERKAATTNYAERQNLTMRMSMRRFMRRTNGHSKDLRYHSAACGLYFLHYNFVRVNKSIKTTPAVKVGIADHPWSIRELLSLIDGRTSKPVRLFQGVQGHQFCHVCGQVMLFQRTDSTCSRHCRSSEIYHLDDSYGAA